jgi:sugar lactone lactonase YvrE
VVTGAVVGEMRARLGEGPTWDREDDCLWWVDIPGALIVRTSLDGQTTTWPCPSMPGSLARTREGDDVLVALTDGFYRFDIETGGFDLLAPLAHGPGLMMNDGKCDPAGRFVAGSMTTDGAQRRASLYSLDAGDVRTLREGLTTSNGLDWSPDGSVMYYVDSPTHRLEAFDYDLATGDLGEGRVVWTFDPGLGQPDGLTIDVEGGVWVVLWGSAGYHDGGGMLVRISADGELDAEMRLPTVGTTSCTFGGPDLRTLFVTTSKEFLGPDQQTDLAGALLAFDVGVAGARPATRYGS